MQSTVGCLQRANKSAKLIGKHGSGDILFNHGRAVYTKTQFAMTKLLKNLIAHGLPLIRAKIL